MTGGEIRSSALSSQIPVVLYQKALTGVFVSAVFQRLLCRDSLAEFKSVVKDTKSNTKNITKSISIHSDYQGVHFW